MGAGDPGPFDPLIHQAEGVMARQLGVPVSHAGMIMRIRARGRGVTLGDIARDVMAPITDGNEPDVAGPS